MSLVFGYTRLAAAAPGKPKHASKSTKKAKRDFDRSFWLTKEQSPSLVVPDGVRRYYLRVPAHSNHIAAAAGCHYDSHAGRWYIDNPQRIEDFAAWKPSRVGLEKLIAQLKQK